MSDPNLSDNWKPKKPNKFLPTEFEEKIKQIFTEARTSPLWNDIEALLDALKEEIEIAYAETVTEQNKKLQSIIDEYDPKIIAKCKAGPPSDYQNLWILVKEFRDKIKELLGKPQ